MEKGYFNPGIKIIIDPANPKLSKVCKTGNGYIIEKTIKGYFSFAFTKAVNDFLDDLTFIYKNVGSFEYHIKGLGGSKEHLELTVEALRSFPHTQGIRRWFLRVI